MNGLLSLRLTFFVVNVGQECQGTNASTPIVIKIKMFRIVKSQVAGVRGSSPLRAGLNGAHQLVILLITLGDLESFDRLSIHEFFEPHRFLVTTLVIACLIVVPAFSRSLFERPIVTQTLSAGGASQPISFGLPFNRRGAAFSLVIITPFARLY